jgi:hypothetical protein
LKVGEDELCVSASCTAKQALVDGQSKATIVSPLGAYATFIDAPSFVMLTTALPVFSQHASELGHESAGVQLPPAESCNPFKSAGIWYAGEYTAPAS